MRKFIFVVWVSQSVVLGDGSPSRLTRYPFLLCHKRLMCKPRALCIWCKDAFCQGCTGTLAHAGKSVSPGTEVIGDVSSSPPQHCYDRLERELLHFVVKNQVRKVFPHENVLFLTIRVIAKSRTQTKIESLRFELYFHWTGHSFKRKPTLGKSKQVCEEVSLSQVLFRGRLMPVYFDLSLWHQSQRNHVTELAESCEAPDGFWYLFGVWLLGLFSSGPFGWVQVEVKRQSRGS